ncbi:MAG: hypothetical protein IKO42_01395 [Opitutales bacterium]|nr:hypothetical protein [Opitutales bacterium]
MKTQSHKWTFFKAGGVYQAEFNSGADIANIRSLDQKLWAALACPTRGVHFDTTTLDLIDTDRDGRVRSPEVVSACEWACALLKNPDCLLAGSPELKLSDINDATEEGKVLLASAKEVLKNLGKPDADSISVADFADKSAVFAGTAFNADGVITALSAESGEQKEAILSIIKVMGSVADRSGEAGVNADIINGFFDKLKAYAAWRDEAKNNAQKIFVFGDGTAAAYAAYSAVSAKIDDYFTRASILSYGDSSAELVNATKENFAEVLKGDISASTEALAGLPIAKIASENELKLSSEINPAWQAAVGDFREKVVAKVSASADVLPRADWFKIKAMFAPFAAWSAAKSDGGVSDLGDEYIDKLLASNCKEELFGLIAKDESLKHAVDNIEKVEKLARLNRDLLELLTNFVSFKAFYTRKGKAMFQVGELFIDQRVCELCIKVDDAGKHATLSPLSYTYLVYCDCKRKGEAPFSIAAAVTTGDCDNLIVGRNGVFYDRNGKDWDATITKIVQNPISVRQAFWSPYKRFAAWIGNMIAKRASAADADAMNSMTATAEKKEAPKKMDIGTLAAIGVAVGGVTTALSAILVALGGIGFIKLPLYIIGAMLLISLPSMVLASLKLRLRNLGPLLDANAWAVNTRAKMNMVLGATLTKSAALPKGARKNGRDPFAQKRSPWLPIFVILVVAASVYGVCIKAGFVKNPFAKDEPAQEQIVIVEANADAPAAEAQSAAQPEAK